MITREQYDQAVAAHDAAEETMKAFHKQEAEAFEHRMATNPIFTEDELVFAAFNRCPCGYGLAYPKNCGMHHYWDCAGILLGKEDKTVTHTDQLPFSMYSVKSELQPSVQGQTTRGTVVPKAT